MTVTRAVQRFRTWTDALGVTVAASMLGVDAGYVSHLRAGRRTPSLVVAARIERATHGMKGGAITCASWVPVTREVEAA